MTEHPWTATSIRSLIKLLFTTKSKFFSQTFRTMLLIRSLSLFYHRELEILAPVMHVFLLTNIIVPFFIKTEILFILFRIFFFINLHLGRTAEETCPSFWNETKPQDNLILELKNFDFKIKLSDRRKLSLQLFSNSWESFENVGNLMELTVN